MLDAEIKIEEFLSNTFGNQENNEEMGSCKVFSCGYELGSKALSLKIIDSDLSLKLFRWMILDSNTD